ncbi:Per1-like-domain-containing protein [Thamnocephalis sphaerospora]|uniref:Post-GPI attachment to proteins factor 3 n=1 Tax=Thamnocephalis sphaerospora TaxID=78915 RepID=A0A4P9XPK6_9FUNG|nr:Per1-like-domain-containing protein [Thamnocephalis sphaerospora]|eukprot:RKP07945.1 Per1-like-domain-containing protein [Thamnocephalis sphaerospora]
MLGLAPRRGCAGPLPLRGRLVTYLRLLLVLAAIWLPLSVQASAGEHEPTFLRCTSDCQAQRCMRVVDGSREAVNPLPLYLRLLGWSCPDDCDYHCQIQVTDQRLAFGEPVLKYHGKWPLVRILGAQEPAAVLFSVWNGYAHWKNRAVLANHVHPHYYLRPVLLGYAITGINTWLWSAVFHVRDTPFTEKLDYFSAGFGILYGFYLAVCRVFGVQRPRRQRLLLLGCVALFGVHIIYMCARSQFDYGHHQLVCAVVGVAHNLLWCGWALRHCRTRPYAWQVIALVVCVSSTLLLGLLNQQPLGWYLDAHALWHAATAPLVFWWYRFLLADCAWETGAMGESGLSRLSNQTDLEQGEVTLPLVSLAREEHN